MIKFTLLLLITLILAGLWLVTGVTEQISPQAYLSFTVPWWHITLHVGWFIAALATSMFGVSMLIDWRSRRQQVNEVTC